MNEGDIVNGRVKPPRKWLLNVLEIIDNSHEKQLILESGKISESILIDIRNYANGKSDHGEFEVVTIQLLVKIANGNSLTPRVVDPCYAAKASDPNIWKIDNEIDFTETSNTLNTMAGIEHLINEQTIPPHNFTTQHIDDHVNRKSDLPLHATSSSKIESLINTLTHNLYPAILLLSLICPLLFFLLAYDNLRSYSYGHVFAIAASFILIFSWMFFSIMEIKLLSKYINPAIKKFPCGPLEISTSILMCILLMSLIAISMIPKRHEILFSLNVFFIYFADACGFVACQKRLSQSIDETIHIYNNAGKDKQFIECVYIIKSFLYSNPVVLRYIILLALSLINALLALLQHRMINLPYLSDDSHYLICGIIIITGELTIFIMRAIRDKQLSKVYQKTSQKI